MCHLIGMSLAWYGSQTDSDACNFGALAVIYPLLKRMKVNEIIDQHLPRDVRAEFGHGQILSLLIAARLFRPTALSNVAEWAADSGADLLWDIPLEKINDDRLGRSLDAFFRERHSILAHLALHVSQEFGVPLKEFHYDPTHILFAGAYEDAEPREGVVGKETTRSDGGLLPAHITKGRATDDAPQGALMIHAGLCTQVDEFGPLPLFGHTVDGNQNGRTAVAEQFALLRKHLPHVKLTMYSDRGTFSAGHLRRLTSEGFHAVCSVPWDEFRPLFDQQGNLAWKTASFLSIEQQRRRADGSELPQEHYQLATVRHALVDNESKQEIPCRVIFVFSTADQKVVRKQRQKQIDKLQAGLEKVRTSVAAGRRPTDADAITRRVQKLFGTKQAARYFTWQLIPLTKKQQAALPAPERGCKRATHRFAFTFDRAAVRHDETYDGYSALVTTVPQNQASADTLFTKFKEQNYSEHAHRQFKGPLAVSPVFLHAPHRVEALVFLLMIALTTYFLLQRLYRQSIPVDAPQKDRRTTTQTILRAFRTYLLLVHHTRLGREIRPTRLSARQRELLQRLGFPTPAQILSQLLPRPPT
jgi:transposase